MTLKELAKYLKDHEPEKSRTDYQNEYYYKLSILFNRRIKE